MIIAVLYNLANLLSLYAAVVLVSIYKIIGGWK
jgi:hypothetical protein